MITGWFDVYQRGVLLNYTALQNAWAGRPWFGPMRRNQRATPRYQIVQGPWFHNPVGMGEWIAQIHLEWFDRWLRGQRTRLTSTRRPLHAYELGGGRWVDESAYPLPRTRVRTLYFGGGTLSSQRPRSAASDRIPWTPAASPCNRHPDQWSTGFGGYLSAWAGQPMNPCAQDDSTTQAGALTYTTKPFSRDTTLAGPASVGVYLDSTTVTASWSRRSRTSAPTAALIRSPRARCWDRCASSIAARRGATAASSSCPPIATRARAGARSRPAASSARTSRCRRCSRGCARVTGCGSRCRPQ